MILDTYLDNPDLYHIDLRYMVSSTIEKYGKNEWMTAVLTTQMHGHLGVYAIVGVKMGVRALEYLEAEKGDVFIESFAGINPPVSCLNDGLQVSTGATLGHGLIQSSPAENPYPEAIFKTETKAVRIKLKDRVWSVIKDEISGAVSRYGHSKEYWEYVRKLAVRYWEEMDRNEIFEITALEV